MQTDCVCRIADWQAESAQLLAIRYRVFVEEQHVPIELEADEFDHYATHFVVETHHEHDTTAIATGRLKADGQIGRMAVLVEYRGTGIGSLLLKSIIAHADANEIPGLYLHSQLDATGFYQRHGFETTGEIFQDAGIPHRAMVRICAKKSV